MQCKRALVVGGHARLLGHEIFVRPDCKRGGMAAKDLAP
jgi:hypothetical protein